MAANTTPIFALTPNVGKASIASAFANVKSDGTGTIATDSVLAFTAGVNGSYVYSVRFTPVAATAATTTTNTTLRAFLSTIASGATTNANTFLIGEVSALAQTADHSTVPTFFIEIPINKFIPASWTILATQHVAQTTALWQVLVFGGDF